MRLRVWLPPLSELRPDASVEFEVIDANRRVQHCGESSIVELPKGLDCELVLYGRDTVLLDVRLPRLSGSKLAAALPSLVEERLSCDAESVHVVASPRDPDGAAMAVVVDKALFHRALDMFARAGRSVVAAIAQPLALVSDTADWHMRIRDGFGSVRTGPVSGMSFSTVGEPPIELKLLLDQTIAPPATIFVDGDCDATAWSESLGVTVKQMPAERTAAAVTLDLLQYQFAPGVADWKRWRTTTALATTLMAIMLIGLNLHAWKLRAEEQLVRKKMTAVVKEAIPGVTAVLDPLAQMQRRVADLRAGAGIDDNGFLAISRAFAEVTNVDSVRSMEFRNGKLTVQFVSGDFDTGSKRESLIASASKTGLVVRFSSDGAVVSRKGGA